MQWGNVNLYWEWLTSTWAQLGNKTPLNFPDTPANQDVFGKWAWNEAESVWDFV